MKKLTLFIIAMMSILCSFGEEQNDKSQVECQVKNHSLVANWDDIETKYASGITNFVMDAKMKGIISYSSSSSICIASFVPNSDIIKLCGNYGLTLTIGNIHNDIKSFLLPYSNDIIAVNEQNAIDDSIHNEQEYLDESYRTWINHKVTLHNCVYRIEGSSDGENNIKWKVELVRKYSGDM